MPPDELVHTLLGVAVLVAITATTLGLRRTPHPWAPAWAVLRGGLQLAAVALVLAGVIQNPWWVGLALLVMFSVAAWTATRRLGADLAHLGLVAGSMGAGVLVTLAVVFGTGALALTSRYALAIGGIVIGNSMSIATLVGRQLNQLTRDHWEEVEGWLALGATGRQATATIARESIHHALIPTTDQTRTTGLVTLPGAFVGAIFGGVSPLEAGRFQLVVLSAVMAAGSIAAVQLAHWLAPAATRPDPLG
ncbi:MAG: ABC transporter permease [Cellulomonas sp.]|nr:ABC transporter permease [Cellulomonas sp.]